MSHLFTEPQWCIIQEWKKMNLRRGRFRDVKRDRQPPYWCFFLAQHQRSFFPPSRCHEELPYTQRLPYYCSQKQSLTESLAIRVTDQVPVSPQCRLHGTATWNNADKDPDNSLKLHTLNKLHSGTEIQIESSNRKLNEKLLEILWRRSVWNCSFFGFSWKISMSL